MITKKVIVKGKVQGVFFRDYTKRQATSLGLTGWVRNLADGSVEALLFGEEELIKSMLNWFHEGSPHSRVDEVLVYDVKADKSCSSFEIRY
ncbi:acylphosphatase [Desulfomarina sp.]